MLSTPEGQRLQPTGEPLHGSESGTLLQHSTAEGKEGGMQHVDHCVLPCMSSTPIAFFSEQLVSLGLLQCCYFTVFSSKNCSPIFSEATGNFPKTKDLRKA